MISKILWYLIAVMALSSCAGKEPPPDAISQPRVEAQPEKSSPVPGRTEPTGTIPAPREPSASVPGSAAAAQEPPFSQSPAPSSPAPASPPPTVTVKLFEIKGSLLIRMPHDERATIWCVRKRGGVSTFQFSSSANVSLRTLGLLLESPDLSAPEMELSLVLFQPDPPGSFLYLNDAPYRGEIIVHPGAPAVPNGDPTALVVLDKVPVEDYLRGVVTAEIGRLERGEIEAVKAQAVAARTYADSRLRQFAELGYDLEATVKDQVYLGVKGEDPLADEAIEATKGVVMMCDGRPINAYYHANCGGMTESIERIWDKPAARYLVPVEDAYCGWATSHDWEETWRPADLERNFAAFLDTVVTLPAFGLGTLLDLYVGSRSPSGRVESLVAVTRSGAYTIGKDRIRWAMKRGSDPNRILRSTHFDLEVVRNGNGTVERVRARGLGTGHGVGMCQTGAIGMAREGFSYEEILTHFYPGIEFRQWGEKHAAVPPAE